MELTGYHGLFDIIKIVDSCITIFFQVLSQAVCQAVTNVECKFYYTGKSSLSIVHRNNIGDQASENMAPGHIKFNFQTFMTQFFIQMALQFSALIEHLISHKKSINYIIRKPFLNMACYLIGCNLCPPIFAEPIRYHD